jgi:hypothetical protein
MAKAVAFCVHLHFMRTAEQKSKDMGVRDGHNPSAD